MARDYSDPRKEFQPAQKGWDWIAFDQWRAGEGGDRLDERQKAVEEIEAVIGALMVTALTERQRQIMELYYHEGLTQEAIAARLGITQPTVSQHLMGRLRRGVRIGGALRKIRKAVHKVARARAGEATPYVGIITALDRLLDDSITRRRARAILDGLGPADDSSPEK